ncbi:MAG: CoA-binding protein [Chloroflexi bacterium]|nr:CoA-binding protein [Chloroflexota bacterium]
MQISEEDIPGIEAMGIPNYKNLTEVPDQVDHVIVTVPRAVAPRILEDAIKARANSVMFFTSGFAETGEPEGIRLQNLLTLMARTARMKVVGPNCMGIFNPRIGLRHGVDQYVDDGGPAAFISQSGTHANLFTQSAYQHGVKMSKSVSMGNGIVLHVTDYLEYFAQDPETELIAMYVEGVPDGRRLFSLLKEVTLRKPVVIWKGGQTQEGARAVQSHTASLASSYSLWQAMAKQTGAVLVDSMAELIDVTKGLLFIKPARGPRMGLVATTGGQSVVITDAFAKVGLQVPLLTDKSYQEYSSFYSVIGGSYRNPLDMSPNLRDPSLTQRILRILEQDPNIDAICFEINVGFGGRRPETTQTLLDLVVAGRKEFTKPFFCVLTAAHREKEAMEIRQALAEKGVVSFPTFQQAALTFRRLLDYFDTQRELRTQDSPGRAAL